MMTFTKYLRALLTDFVDEYKKYYLRTNGATVVFTLVVFVFIALLFHFNIYDKTNTKKDISLLSYFFIRYSAGDTYSIVDLSKAVFLFFVSIFSISLSRLERGKSGKSSFNLTEILKNIDGKDILYLFTGLAISIIADYLLFRSENLAAKPRGASDADRWIHGMFFLLRIYVPLVVFSMINYNRVTGNKPNYKPLNLIWLFVSLWLFNEFAYEVSMFVRGHIFELLMLPFPADSRYYIESMLGIPLISFYFLGYHSAMTNSMLLLHEGALKNNTPENE
jgi:hypothetical protein